MDAAGAKAFGAGTVQPGGVTVDTPFKGVIVKRIHIRLIRIWSRTNAHSVAVAVDGINPCAPLRR